MQTTKDVIIELTNHIPYGRFSTYGSLATQASIILGKNITPRVVGRILSSMKEDERDCLPRWRVVNSRGYISAMKLGEKGLIQMQQLLKEGVQVDTHTHSLKDFSDYVWYFVA